MALTDHDNTDGLRDFLSASEGPATRIAGIELSVEADEGFDNFHLLGLGIDPDNSKLKAFLSRILKGRRDRNAAILANFARLGIEIDPADLAALAPGGVLARPHFANWLVAHGHAPSFLDAFKTYLLADSPAATRCYEPRVRPSQEESFRVIHGAGGLCVMAHPKFLRRRWRTEGTDFAAAERAIAAAKERGLDGLEALYRANSVEEDIAFVRIADQLGLVKSAGSDFHGANKPTIPLGMEVSAAFIAPLSERLGGVACVG